MPAFGTNNNVMCYVDDIFVYLRARANNAVGRARPDKHDEKPESARKWEEACMGTVYRRLTQWQEWAAIIC